MIIIEIESLTYCGKKYCFRRPVEVDVQVNEQMWACDIYEIGLRAYGLRCDEEDVMADMGEEFDVMWQEYVISPESGLAPDAIALRRKLLELVGSIDKKN